MADFGRSDSSALLECFERHVQQQGVKNTDFLVNALRPLHWNM
jgi:hypothetical protein